MYIHVSMLFWNYTPTYLTITDKLYQKVEKLLKISLVILYKYF